MSENAIGEEKINMSTIERRVVGRGKAEKKIIPSSIKNAAWLYGRLNPLSVAGYL